MNDSIHNLSSYEIIKSITLSIPIASNQIKVDWLSESTGLILGLHPANERWNYFVTTSLVGWSQAQNQSWCIGNHIAFRCVNCVHNGLNTHNGMSFCVYLPSHENILRNKLQWHLYIFIQEHSHRIHTIHTLHLRVRCGMCFYLCIWDRICLLYWSLLSFFVRHRVLLNPTMAWSN